MNNTDELEIEILPDGRIKTTTPGSVSAANHSNAEAFFRFIATMTDGSNERTNIKQVKEMQKVNTKEKA